MAFGPNSTKRVGAISKGWAREFDDPIPLPRGRLSLSQTQSD